MTDFDPFQASASSVSKFELCHRKWAWHAIDQLDGPPSPAAEFGSRVHSHIEHWFTKKTPPVDGTPEQKVAQAIIAHLPPPQSVRVGNVEVALSMRLGGVFFVGYIDLFMPEHPETGRPRVYDHKTTSDFGWALAPETMVDDVQATLYAAWAFLRTKADVVELQWTYGRTKGAAKSLPVIREVTKADIQERVNKTVESAKVMRELLSMGVSAIEVPYNAEGCEAFGGCPFQENCKLSAQERIESIMSQGNAQGTLLEQLRAKRSNNKPAAAAGTSSQKVNPDPTPAPASTEGMSPLEKLRAKKKAAEAAPAPAPVEEAPQEETPATPAARGPGRPRKSAAAAAPEPPAALTDTPKQAWTLFAAAALVGGKSAAEASEVAGELLLAQAELFPED